MKIHRIKVVITMVVMLVCSCLLVTQRAHAVSPAATFSVTTSVAGVPDQAARWQENVVTSGAVSRMTLSMPYAMYAGVPITSLHAVTTLSAGTLAYVPGGIQYTVTKPVSLAAGTRVWMTIQGLTTPPAGTTTSLVRLWNSSGVKLSDSSASLTTTSPVACRTAAWPSNYVQVENNIPGDANWKMTYSGKLAAYAENPSVTCGDTVHLRVNDLDVNTLSLIAYRLGYYNGAGARKVWATTKGPWLIGAAQPKAQFVPADDQGRTINMVTAKNWSRSFSFRIDGSWTPGVYLIQILTSSGQGRYVPIVVRDDLGQHAQHVILNSTEWQAYNSYGGYDAYSSPRSSRLSFDRPYLQNGGSGNLLSYEYGYIYWGEKERLDLSYVMDTDDFADLSRMDNQKMITLIGHPEYWPVSAFQKLADERAAGTNILSLTANALYWRVNFKPSTLTGPYREFESFKLPGTDTDTFRMGGMPEQTVLGAQYGCTSVDGTGVANSSWLWTNVPAGTQVPHLINVEGDEIMSGWAQAPGAQIVDTIPKAAGYCKWSASSSGVAINAPGCPSACAWDPNQNAFTIMSISGVPGGRVFHASSIGWPTALLNSAAAGQATLNAISFLNNGLATNSTQTAGSSTETSRLASPRLQITGPLKPDMPVVTITDER